MSLWIIRLNDTEVHVRGFGARPRNMARVIVDGPRIFGVNDKGQMFCNLVNGNSYMPPKGQCLIVLGLAAKLGVLDSKAVEALEREQARRREIYSRAYSAYDLEDAAKRFGYKLPPRIRRKIEEANKAKKALA